ncbi:hypothetical protein NL676_001343 [Syzygium grande]|nr:hypothetical protein NL676_001343 [Syzygium grande]
MQDTHRMFLRVNKQSMPRAGQTAIIAHDTARLAKESTIAQDTARFPRTSKAVIKVCMNDDTLRFCCFGPSKLSLQSFERIQSVALGVDKDQIEVTGIFDPIDLTTLLRKKVGYSEIVTVSEVGESKDKPRKTEEVPPIVCQCPRPEIVFIGDPYPDRGCWF